MALSNRSPSSSSEHSAPARAAHDPSPLSLSRLRDAFAEMLGGGKNNAAALPADEQPPPGPPPAHARLDAPADAACEISPKSVVESMLFVGRPENETFSARELAAAMRGVSPGEIDTVISELNQTYDADATPYHIQNINSGYRLVLREEFERMRDKFYGRVREARLSTAAVEVLSVIAYNQPVTSDEISQLRGAPSGAALSTLVRRKLVRLERPFDGCAAQYFTSDRFLRLFGLENLAALPRSEELEKA